MSAMHWEARRRQHALDRRMARDKQQELLQRGSGGSEAGCSATESNPTQEKPAGDQCPHCKADLRTPKIPNRYSYTQQW